MAGVPVPLDAGTDGALATDIVAQVEFYGKIGDGQQPVDGIGAEVKTLLEGE